MNLRAKSQKGFTIVELLIVIVVIAILAAISIVAFTGVQQRARDTQRAANAKTVADAISAYNASEGTWPGAAATAALATTGIRANFTSYNTVKVPSDVIANISVVDADPVAADATSANGSQIRVRFSGTTAAPTGATVFYVKENGGWGWLNYKVGAAV